MATYRIKRFSNRFDPTPEQLEDIEKDVQDYGSYIKEDHKFARTIFTGLGSLAGFTGLGYLGDKLGKSEDIHPALSIASAITPAVAINRGMKHFQTKSMNRQLDSKRVKEIDRVRRNNQRNWEQSQPLTTDKLIDILKNIQVTTDKDYRKEPASIRVEKNTVTFYFNLPKVFERVVIENFNEPVFWNMDVENNVYKNGFKTRNQGKTLIIETPNDSISEFTGFYVCPRRPLIRTGCPLR